MPASLFTPNLVSVASAGAYGFGDGLAIALSTAANDQLTNFKNIAGLNKSAESIAALTGNAAAADTYKEMGRGLLLSGGDPLKVQEMMFKVAMDDKNSRDRLEELRLQGRTRDWLDSRNTLRNIGEYNNRPASAGSAGKQSYNSITGQMDYDVLPTAGFSGGAAGPSRIGASQINSALFPDDPLSNVPNPDPGVELPSGPMSGSFEGLPQLNDPDPANYDGSGSLGEQLQRKLYERQNAGRVQDIGPAEGQGAPPAEMPAPAATASPQGSAASAAAAAVAAATPTGEAKPQRLTMVEQFNQDYAESGGNQQDYNARVARRIRDTVPANAHSEAEAQAQELYSKYQAETRAQQDQEMQIAKANSIQEKSDVLEGLREMKKQAMERKEFAKARALETKMRGLANKTVKQMGQELRSGTVAEKFERDRNTVLGMYQKHFNPDNPNPPQVKMSEAYEWAKSAGFEDYLASLDSKAAAAAVATVDRVTKGGDALEKSVANLQLIDKESWDLADQEIVKEMYDQTQAFSAVYQNIFDTKPDIPYYMQKRPRGERADEVAPSAAPAAPAAPATPTAQPRLGVPRAPTGLLPAQ